MVHISKSSLPEFLSRRPLSVVHLDANWDGYRKAMDDKIQGIASDFEDSVSFGYLDCDDEKEYAREIGILNVPSVAYYRGTELVGIVVGIRQDITENIRRLMHREQLDQTNKLSRG
jgi:thioredoxin-like negative regulator of GroEL